MPPLVPCSWWPSPLPPSSRPPLDAVAAHRVEVEAQELRHFILEETSSVGGLVALHDRARRAGTTDPRTLAVAFSSESERAELLQLLVRSWDEADLGLMDEWLVAIMWMLDRIRLRRHMGRQRSTTETPQIELWAAALIVLKMSNAETQLETSMKHVVLELVLGSDTTSTAEM